MTELSPCCNHLSIQYARTPEAPTAERWDWRTFVIGREAVQSSETHCWEGTAYGKLTGLYWTGSTHKYVLLYQRTWLLYITLICFVSSGFILPRLFRHNTFFHTVLCLGFRMQMWSAAPALGQEILAWPRCSSDPSWSMKAPRLQNQSVWCLSFLVPNR